MGTYDWVSPRFDDDFAILLAGCTSSNLMSNIYLLSLQYTSNFPTASVSGQVSTAIMQAIHSISQTGNGTSLEVRAGYMGLCVMQSDSERICSSSARALANLIKAEKSTISQGNTSTEFTPDPLNLIMIANDFREKIVIITIILIATCLIVLSTFPGWHEEFDETGSDIEVRPFPKPSAVTACLFTTGLGFGFGLTSILWQHINSSSTASMTETLTYGAASGHVGSSAMALGWIGVGLIALVGLGILTMKLSISYIKRLHDENDQHSMTGSSV
ncbi:hypothetical protein N7462_011471 [Penicillium macrosclerotiorum]|uniref:uncharacterized protein n=1 Tax=Penicillium macrosclerotiorum TaxID=303699 RepID=UPI002549663F|nr:uncharacterized protein N7462_011471 [Penicillium macrosclerotiorum]KAJ5664658.1 hypothetical protein N7462_011471 [Penicillium macrosclerotiorum]